MQKKWMIKELLFKYLCLISIIIPLAILVFLLAFLLVKGLGRININFLLGFPSRKAELAGILPAIIGSFCLVGLVILIAVPLGIASAIYLEEYNKEGIIKKIIDINVFNLSGIPSVIFGLLGLELFVRILGLGHSLIAGGLTISLLVLPIVICSAKEAIIAVPNSLKEACYGLGATKWRGIWLVVLPTAMPGILTGVILAVSRTLGESAPLIVIGAATYISYLPQSVYSEFTVLPLLIFNWIARPQKEFAINSAAAIIVLLSLLFVLNIATIIIRNKLQNKRF